MVWKRFLLKGLIMFNLLVITGCVGLDEKGLGVLGELKNNEVRLEKDRVFGFGRTVEKDIAGEEIEVVKEDKKDLVEIGFDGEFEVYEILKMILSQAGYAVVCGSVGKVFVVIDGKYTKDEIIDLARGIVGGMGLSLDVDGRVCTVRRVDNSGSVYEFIAVFRTKYLIFEKELLGSLVLGEQVRITNYKDVVLVMGEKLKVLRVVESIKKMDVDILKNYFVRFVSCYDSSRVMNAIASMYEVPGVKVLPVSVDMVVVVTKNSEYLGYVTKLIKSLSAFGLLTEVYVYKARYKSIEEIEGYLNAVEKVELKADKELSAVFLKCSYEKYLVLRRYLESFDVLCKQVLMRLYMIDIRGSRDLGMGADWFLESGSFGLSQGGFVEDVVGGISSAYEVGNVKNFFSMLEKVLDAKVISKPSIYVKSGQEAEIKFTNSVPVLVSKGSGQSVGVGTGIIQNIEYKDVGVIFRIKPVCIGNNILIEVYIENSSLQKETGVENNPMFFKDSVRTNFSVRDGAFCVLGGIRFENNEVSISGLPFLSRVKFLGFLFGGYKKFHEKREMMVCLYPKVVRDEYESDRLSESLLEGLNLN